MTTPINSSADPVDVAEAGLKRRAYGLLMSNEQAVLRELIDRWLAGPPQVVLAWLDHQQASDAGGRSNG